MDIEQTNTNNELTEATDKIDDIRQILGSPTVERVQYQIKKFGDVIFERTNIGFEVSFVAWKRGGNRESRTDSMSINIETGRVDINGIWRSNLSLRDLIEIAQSNEPQHVSQSREYLSEYCFSEGSD